MGVRALVEYADDETKRVDITDNDTAIILLY
jgi:hypothetical protein